MNPWGLVFLAWLFADGDGPRFRYISAQETIEIHDFLIEKYGGERGIICEGGIYFIPEKATLKKSIEAAAAVYLFEIIAMHPSSMGTSGRASRPAVSSSKPTVFI